MFAIIPPVIVPSDQAHLVNAAKPDAAAAFAFLAEVEGAFPPTDDLPVAPTLPEPSLDGATEASEDTSQTKPVIAADRSTDSLWASIIVAASLPTNLPAAKAVAAPQSDPAPLGPGIALTNSPKVADAISATPAGPRQADQPTTHLPPENAFLSEVISAPTDTGRNPIETASQPIGLPVPPQPQAIPSTPQTVQPVNRATAAGPSPLDPIQGDSTQMPAPGFAPATPVKATPPEPQTRPLLATAAPQAAEQEPISPPPKTARTPMKSRQGLPEQPAPQAQPHEPAPAAKDHAVKQMHPRQTAIQRAESPASLPNAPDAGAVTILSQMERPSNLNRLPSHLSRSPTPSPEANTAAQPLLPAASTPYTLQMGGPSQPSVFPPSRPTPAVAIETAPRNDCAFEQPAKLPAGDAFNRTLSIDPANMVETEGQAVAPSVVKNTEDADLQTAFEPVLAELSQLQPLAPATRPDHALRHLEPAVSMASLPGVLAELSQRTETQAVTLQLDPVELGKVAFNFDSGPSGLIVAITAERPETVDLLRRNADQLLQDLRQSGIQSASLQFSQSGNSGHGQNTAKRSHTPFGTPAPAVSAASSPGPAVAKGAIVGGLHLRL